MPASATLLSSLDLTLVAGYLGLVVALGFWLKRRGTRGLDAYFLAGRNVPWWLLGLSGCSSYIDIGGTMAMVGALYYLGLQAVWVTHIWWGWFIICFYMAFQAKWIRRSGVMTFAEWNRTRFGTGRDAEAARVAAALFLLALMVCNLMYIAVGIGKFAEDFLPLERWQSVLLVYAAVGLYVTLGGFLGVILTDLVQTVLIAAGALLLAGLAFGEGGGEALAAAQPAGWHSLLPSWRLWPEYAAHTPEAYRHFEALGPLLAAGSLWVLFRVLAGPNVWDFQFFLTARSPRDAALAGGVWTAGYTLRWILGCSFLVLAWHLLGPQAGADAEKIMPQVLLHLPVGVRGLFVAVLLAALMSTLDAMVNVTSSVVTNDLLKRYFLRDLAEKWLVRLGQLASVGALFLGFLFSLLFRDVVSAWETMIFVVVTMVLVPATCRWHWWRFSARAFVWGMAGSAAFVALEKLVLEGWLARVARGGDLEALSLALNVAGSIGVTLAAAFLTRPADMDVLVRFYAQVRPFGFWGPVRREAVRRGLVPARDPVPRLDAINGLLAAALQLCLCLVPFYALLARWREAALGLAGTLVLAAVLYCTWYRWLPPPEPASPGSGRSR